MFGAPCVQLVGHKLGLEWKKFESGKRSERELQRQVGLEYTGSLAGQTKAEGAGRCVGALGSEGRVPSGKEAYLGFHNLGGEIPAGGWDWSVDRGLSLPSAAKVQSRSPYVTSLPPGQVLHEYYLGQPRLLLQ